MCVFYDYKNKRGELLETNFDYLLEKSEYASFAAQAVEAEKSIAIKVLI